MNEKTIEEHIGVLPALLRDAGGEAEPAGFRLVRLIKMVSTLYETIGDEQLQAAELSGPRWRLLWRLRGEEVRGDARGCSPTHLSHCQRVSKNTISALLRGLEVQGLVERTLDPDDRRGFRIRLTDSGRRLLIDTAPQHLEHLNELVSGLSPAEQGQLTALLEKLYRSLAQHAHKSHEL